MERHRRLKALEARLYEIAMGTTGVTGNVCIRAAEALLNRIEGKPKAMSFDLPVDDFCMFSDDELVAELDRLRVPVL